jgi:hypothetical protein
MRPTHKEDDWKEKGRNENPKNNNNKIKLNQPLMNLLEHTFILPPFLYLSRLLFFISNNNNI